MDGEDFLRKLRGLLVLGTLWGVGWGAVGAVVGLVIALVVGLPAGLWTDLILEWGLGIGAYGFLSGVTFGKVLWLLEERRTLDEVSAGRVAGWSALGAALVPVLFGMAGFFEPGTTTMDVLQAMLLTSVLGAASAAGTLAMARRALPGGSDVGASDLESDVEAGLDAEGASDASPHLLDEAPPTDPLASRRARERQSERGPGRGGG